MAGSADGGEISGRIEKKGCRLVLRAVALLFLVLYPLRHINWGLDFWDTGYNYANFTYMGMEHMDSMWLFATYLANVVGHFLTKLPGAGGLLGMNFYTGLTVSVMAVWSYSFCTRKLKMPQWSAFLGEVAAISLCWCPTALLYNYLTYLLFTGCVVFLYKGLTEERMGYLFIAGCCLGANVLVRFSNLPEAAMILAVWCYAFWERHEKKKPKAESGIPATWRLILRYTLWCVGGYLTALAVLFGYIHLRYGLDAYMTGIRRLMAMTDTASDYKSTSMLAKMIFDYMDNLYWIWRIGIIIAFGVLLFGAAGLVEKKMKRKPKQLKAMIRAAWCIIPVAMVCWLYYRGFCSRQYYSYGAILRPGISFLTLTLGIAVIRILQPKVPKEERLISCMVVLMVLLTSIGSNNGNMPSLNHLFIPAPYTFWMCYRFIKNAADVYIPVPGGQKPGQGASQAVWVKWFPVKSILIALLALFWVQSLLFGWCFVFAEATGVQNATAYVRGNQVLKGIKMSPDRAGWVEELSGYVEKKGLTGREVILFGNIPAMSYYLQMPSAFNPWSDLASYNGDVMGQALESTAEKTRNGTSDKPVILLDATYARYMQGGESALEEAGISEKAIGKIKENDSKIRLLNDYIQRQGYRVTFENGKFVMME